MIPYILPATAYGNDLADLQHPGVDGSLREGRHGRDRRLVNGSATDQHAVTPTAPWNAHHFSDSLSQRLSNGRRRRATEVVDLRGAVGLSKVGDWVGSNADTVGPVLP